MPHSDVRLTHVLEPETNRWSTRATFYYADNSTTPPALLRDVPEQNFLTPSVRAFGLSLLGIGWGVCVLNAIFIAIHRKHPVLKASQPLFLLQLSLGSAILLSAIFPISFDESYGWTTSMLSAACTSLPWLIVIGHITEYMALFAKVSNIVLLYENWLLTRLAN